MKVVWLCTKCWQPGPEPDRKLLDQSYGSARCHSLFCHNEYRVFHKETEHDNSGPVPVSGNLPRRP